MEKNMGKSKIITTSGNRSFGEEAITFTEEELQSMDKVMMAEDDIFSNESHMKSRSPHEDSNNEHALIHKSSRHSKITGDFAEHIILYWLSKYGYECARVDHVGVDLIARDRSNNITMGISVKSRSREYDPGKRAPGLMKERDIDLLRKTCRVFGWTPHVAFLVDSPAKMFIILLSLPKYLSFGKTTVSFKPGNIADYKADPDIRIVEFDHFTSDNW